MLLTGDFDTRDSPLVSGAQPVQADILFVEGTYGGRDHPPKEEEIDRFIQSVAEVVRRGEPFSFPLLRTAEPKTLSCSFIVIFRTSMFMLTVWVSGGENTYGARFTFAR